MSDHAPPHRYEVYVYDTEIIQSEYDDPLKAVLFHHPPELSQEHVLVTAGQLAGIAHFFSMTLGEEARFFQLEKGRFEIERSGRFQLFVGDMTVQSTMTHCSDDDSARRLKDNIMDAVEFFFGGLDKWHANHEAAAQEKKKECFCKSVASFLNSFFQRFVHTEEPLPKIDLPQGFMYGLQGKCKRVAKECHEHPETRGCLIRIQGKVVFSTFSPSATGFLRIVKSAAKLSAFLAKKTSFRLPVGVSLLTLASNPKWYGEDEENPLEKLTLDYKSGVSASSSSSSGSSVSDWDEMLEENVGFPPKSRKSVASRNIKYSSKERLQRREEEDLVSLLRKTLFRMSSRSPHATQKEQAYEMQSALYVQTFGVVELYVGLSSKSISEALIRDYWNIALSKLPKLSLYLKKNSISHD